MPKTPQAWNPDDYSPVRERVDAFRTRHPTGRIVTELVRQTRTRVTFRAAIYRTTVESEPASTGWASEREGDGEINQASCLENAETSAVGRALANLGFHGTRPRARGADAPASASDGTLHLLREPAPTSPPGDAARESPPPARDAEADALLDTLMLLESAERRGLPPERARAVRRSLTTRSIAPSTRLKAELELRAWLRERRHDGR